MSRAVKALVAVAAVVVLLLLGVRAVGGGFGDAGGDGADSGDGGGGGGPGSSRPRATLPAVPAGVPAEGLYVDSQVTADGEVAVQTWLRSAEPVSELRLTTTDPDLAPGSVESLDVVVRGPDGRVLAVRDSVGTNPQTIRLRRAVTELYLAYTVDGALDDASPTVTGRELVRVLAMDVDYDGAGGTVRRVVSGPGTVLNVACLRPTEDFDASPRPCGRATDDGGWQVDLRGPDRQDRLLAQLEGA